MTSKNESGFRRLFPLLKPHYQNLIWGGVCMCIYVLCWPLLAVLAGKLIPAIGKGNLTEVINVIIKALIVFFIQKIAQFVQDTLLAEPSLKVSQELRINLFKKLQRIDFNALQKLSTGDITYRLTEDADRVGEILYKTIQDTVPSLLQLLAVFGYMTFIDWKLSIATLLLAPLVTALVTKFGSKVMRAAEQSQSEVSDLAALLGESIQALPVVRAFAAEDWQQQKFNYKVEQHRRARYKTLKLLALQHPVVGFIEATGILTVLAIGAARIQAGQLDSEGFSSYVAALLMLIDPISHLTINFNELKQAQASLKRLRQIEREPMEVEDNTSAINIKNVTGEIQFESVSFSYTPGEKVLTGFDIKVEKGKVVALVGPSGAGKSTIFSLLLRFIQAKEGRILIGGNEINSIRIKDLRTQIALVPQRESFLSGSISESIRFGRKASRSEIISASKMANCHNFIMKMPNKYDTEIEERGVNFSGGQLQRIAIARAIIGNPSILLLDEATSALDAEAEEEVQTGLKQAMNNRTVIVIAHRLSTVQEADQIIVLDKGQISEVGSHDELLNKKGRYRELCQKQFIRQGNPT